MVLITYSKIVGGHQAAGEVEESRLFSVMCDAHTSHILKDRFCEERRLLHNRKRIVYIENCVNNFPFVSFFSGYRDISFFSVIVLIYAVYSSNYTPTLRMSAFSLLPFHDEHSFDTPFPPLTSDVDRLARDVQRLQRELGIIGGITHRKDVFEVYLDVQGYKPENINIEVQDNLLTISGSHEEKDEEGIHYQARHFTRKFMLPEDIQLDKMKSCLTKTGRFWCLKVEAPLKQKTQEIPLTINYKWAV